MLNTRLIVGLGKSGLSVARYLMQQNLPVAIADSRTNPPGIDNLRAQFPELPVYLGEFSADLFLQAKEIIISPGLSLQLPAIVKAREAGIPIIGDIELFARAASARSSAAPSP